VRLYAMIIAMLLALFALCVTATATTVTASDMMTIIGPGPPVVVATGQFELSLTSAVSGFTMLDPAQAIRPTTTTMALVATGFAENQYNSAETNKWRQTEVVLRWLISQAPNRVWTSAV
jgi:hypothetical protein